MVEHITRIKLSELITVRVVCVACSTVTEVAFDKLDQTFGLRAHCPCCRQAFAKSDKDAASGNATHFRELEAAIEKIRQLEHCFYIEFPVKASE